MAKNVKKGRGRGGRSVKDYQNGDAANGYDVAVDGEPGEGHNSRFEPSGKVIAEYKEVVLAEWAEQKRIDDEARLAKQGSRAALARARKRMITDGYHAKELDTRLRKWRLEHKLEHVTDNLDADQREHYAACELAEHDYADTPLGAAAVKAADRAIHGDQQPEVVN